MKGGVVDGASGDDEKDDVGDDEASCCGNREGNGVLLSSQSTASGKSRSKNGEFSSFPSPLHDVKEKKGDNKWKSLFCRSIIIIIIIVVWRSNSIQFDIYSDRISSNTDRRFRCDECWK